MRNSTYFLLVALFMSTIFYTCKTSKVETPAVAATNSFDLIQDKILTKNCAISGCHASNQDATYAQHGLILSAGNAYKNLFQKDPKNATAIQEALKLVIPYDASNSLLYQKLLFETTHKSGKNFGSAMPLGKDFLYQGQIEYIRRWIEAGAPQTGIVADAKLLDDTTPINTAFTPLDPPSAAEGFQMKIDPFEIFPNFEREIFLRKMLGNTDSVYISKFQIKMHPGSHHFILYGYRNNQSLPQLNVIRDLRNQNGTYNFNTFLEMSNHIFYFGGSEANYTFNFPEGMAVALPADMSFDMNSHYFNLGSKSYNGEVYVNLYKTDKSKVKNVLKVLDFGNQSLNIPPNQKTVISKSFTFPNPVKIVTLFSHTHKLGEKFEILINGGSRDGELIYTSTNWEHPNKIDYATPIALKAGEGLTSRITYNNFTNNTVTFGLTTNDEMGIIFGYYYEQ